MSARGGVWHGLGSDRLETPERASIACAAMVSGQIRPCYQYWGAHIPGPTLGLCVLATCYASNSSYYELVFSSVRRDYPLCPNLVLCEGEVRAYRTCGTRQARLATNSLRHGTVNVGVVEGTAFVEVEK